MELRSHQLNALKRMHNGCILNGGVGSGKSLTAIAYYFQQNGGNPNAITQTRMRNPKDLVIITTARKRDTCEWEGELSHFLLSPKESIYYKNKVIIDSWNNIKKYVGLKNTFFIFDEQRVVGYGAWTQAFLKITSTNEWILLSATPGDTWMDYLPVFLANGFYRNKTEFIQEHVIYSRYVKYKIDRYLNTTKLTRLRDRILVDMDFERHTTRHMEDVWCDYDISEYRSITKDRWDPWKNEPIQNAAGLCYAWRKSVNSSEDRQVKLLELLEKHPKAIIFYNYDYELFILRDICSLTGANVREWNGYLHQEIPAREDKWIYLVQYNAGSEGWNCILTDTIIFYSQNYSYKAMEQARGRIDRLTTPFSDLYYYNLKSRAPIDIAISRALVSKKKFNESKFGGGYFGAQ